VSISSLAFSAVHRSADPAQPAPSPRADAKTGNDRPDAALEAHDLYRFHHSDTGEQVLLRGASLTVEPGSFVAIVGQSQTATTALLRCLAGLEEPDNGWIAVNGERLTHRTATERLRVRERMIGLVKSDPDLLPEHTLLHQLMIAMGMKGMVLRSRAQQLLHQAGLGDRLDSYPADLTAGERISMAIARALMSDPAVLLMEEPSDVLNSEQESHLLDHLRTVTAAGIAVVAMTGNPAVAAVADHVFILTAGTLHKI
jgi:putative ABC transport system ATP-binding protein